MTPTTRWLAGVFAPRGGIESSRVAGALAPETATPLTQGALQVAFTGPWNEHNDPLCLLDGYLDNASALASALGLPSDSSPEELLAAGWRRWGAGLPARMRGDFALLLWDRTRGEGLIARDQLGVRSMFLHERSGRLFFACEIRHLLALLPTRPAPDAASVGHWITMSNPPGSRTVYAGIRRLNPGSMLVLNAQGVRERRYWIPRFNAPLAGPEQEIAHEVRSALERAVERRVCPQGITGVLMSGGLDSASVAAVASAQAPGSVWGCSAVFPEHPSVDESVLIDRLRSTLALGGITATVRAGGLLASALEAIAAWGVPLRSWGDFWALPLLRAAAAGGVRVTLGGDGGDELFGVRGYLLADRLRAGHPLQAAGLAYRLPGAGSGPSRRQVAAMIANMALVGAAPYGAHARLRKTFARRVPPRWLRGRTAKALLDSDDPLAWKKLEGPRWWAHAAHGLTRGVEETGVFEHQRRRAASAGLEARHPLFDLDLLELALRQPPLATFDPHRNRPILRAAMAGLLPDSVRLRPQKALFDPLLLDCMAGTDGIAIRALLTDPNAELGAYVDLGRLQRALFDDDRQRREQPFRWMWQVWRLATAECWLRAQGSPGDVLPAGAIASAPRIDLARAPAGEAIAASAAENAGSYVFPP